MWHVAVNASFLPSLAWKGQRGPRSSAPSTHSSGPTGAVKARRRRVTCAGRWGARLPVSHSFHPVGPRWLSSSEEVFSCGWLPTWNTSAEDGGKKKKGANAKRQGEMDNTWAGLDMAQRRTPLSPCNVSAELWRDDDEWYLQSNSASP